jgi:hypothetical protein
VKVEPIKPILKAPGIKRLKQKYGELLSILLQFCFQIQIAPLHHGIQAGGAGGGEEQADVACALGGRQGLTLVHFSPQP